MKRFQGGLVFKARRILYRSILGLRVIKKKKKVGAKEAEREAAPCSRPRQVVRSRRDACAAGGGTAHQARGVGGAGHQARADVAK